MSNKKVAISVRKALLQQKMNLQRKVLQKEFQPVMKTGERLCHLFNPTDQQKAPTRKTVLLTGIALFLAILGRRRAGLLGRTARYVIVNYPGLLGRLM